MLRTLVRGTGRGSTRPLVIGDETIDLRAFRNTPAKGFVPDRSSLQGESGLSNKLRNRSPRRTQQQPVAGQFDDADHKELLNTLGERKITAENKKQSHKSQQRRSKKPTNSKKEEEGKDKQRRAYAQYTPPTDLQTRQPKETKEPRKPKLKEIEIDRVDLSSLIFETGEADIMPTNKNFNEPATLSEEERRKQHMELVGGDYERYAKYNTPLQHAISAQRMYTLSQRDELVNNIKKFTKTA
ncbi:hypothetical protein WALSEDRAFT_31208 [Wallemia mellicola CBS 633.66]|uniref:Uncharacterized protein n=1 Tax=Wallemia mellicola (strain ATCC MYA-4683 / CBS 633.66) TaxID=671144 RepID=I4YIB5_WALMC|nr:hypothetical protein WALSEDRAFT_31208 [Wallemia mellicola CBS 633.66]EIM23707.1 hypothetical protein WALSEDRAFT_31208 [Wallemia mellicola CBS 633.66]|eukprot:XP_006956372.1 hypothetical protein WALSEDRAFT_31208 [Wallemia mellicola CBS 633.66]